MIFVAQKRFKRLDTAGLQHGVGFQLSILMKHVRH